MGEPLLDDEREVFTKLTGREREPRPDGRGVRRRQRQTCWRIAQRLGAGRPTSAVYVHTRAGTWRAWCVAHASPPINVRPMSSSNYTEANFRASPVLAQLIESRTARELRLTNGVDIEVGPPTSGDCVV